jgi:hypothetical protein
MAAAMTSTAAARPAAAAAAGSAMCLVRTMVAAHEGAIGINAALTQRGKPAQADKQQTERECEATAQPIESCHILYIGRCC